MDLKEIQNRYNELANTECCLSCGGAVNYTDIKEGYCCIDLGCGKGTDVLRMAEKVGVSGSVYGIDASDNMLQKARQTAEKLNINNATFLKSDLEKIDLPDNIANIIISNCTINHASNKTAVWNEIFRILKKNGVFVVSDLYASAEVPEIYRNDAKAVSECWAGSVTKEEYLQTLEKCGFVNIQILEESKPYQKGSIEVSSFTIQGNKPGCSCKNH